MSSMTDSNQGTGMMFSSGDVWEELLDNRSLLESQYNVVAGNWPTAYNEVVLVVDKNNQISDYTLYALGLKDQKNLEKNGMHLEKVKK